MTKRSILAFVNIGLFPLWAAVSSGWIVHDMMTKPTPPVKFTSAVLMDGELYPGESLVITYTYNRKQDCAAYVDQFIFDENDVPILQRSLPVGYSKKGEGLTQKVVIPVPVHARPGKHRTMSQRVDRCPEGDTFQRYGEFDFTVLPQPKS